MPQQAARNVAVPETLNESNIIPHTSESSENIKYRASTRASKKTIMYHRYATYHPYVIMRIMVSLYKLRTAPLFVTLVNYPLGIYMPIAIRYVHPYISMILRKAN